jgi:hypothetical protein
MLVLALVTKTLPKHYQNITKTLPDSYQIITSSLRKKVFHIIFYRLKFTFTFAWRDIGGICLYLNGIKFQNLQFINDRFHKIEKALTPYIT